jgi:hypothetical protein
MAIIGGSMEARDGLRVLATLIGGGLLVYAAMVVVRGSLHDVDDGFVDRRGRPVTFRQALSRLMPVERSFGLAQRYWARR